tara:strand:+ start:176 stop:622 length:447 start_codon:yes stop_codon:yes gene_type:complete
MHILLLNGPNLNLLGQREPSIYGSNTLESIETFLKDKAKSSGVDFDSFQSNSEGALVDQIHNFIGQTDAIIINAGAYTHTSIALRDALLSASKPYVEVHLSNTFAREEFRHKSLLADNAVGIVSGFGSMSYFLAFDGIVAYLRKKEPK